MLPWNGKEDNLIDRFDGRALLDFYRDAPPRAPQPKTDDELELEQKVRCLSRHSCLCGTGATGPTPRCAGG